jgi:hypothetical protein
MMISRLVHPDLLKTLNIDFFNRTGTVQQATDSQSTTGQVKKAWADVPGMISISCRIAAAGGGERRFQTESYLDATDTVLLSGTFATLTEKMRFVDDKGNIYDILRVEPDSEGITTRLTLRTVR